MGNNLEKLRGKHQMSQTQLAEKIGISRQALSLSENGKCSVNVALKAAKVLGESVYEVLGSDLFVLVPKTDAEKVAFRQAVDSVLGPVSEYVYEED